uniref:Uncharacterized protein n=1 Tax=Anguilla anguilla TaxID=7936 RepID=A0A0E9XNX8_ANGAN
MDFCTPEFHVSRGENSILGGAGSSKPKYFIHSSTAGGMAALALLRTSEPSPLPPRSPVSYATYKAPPATVTLVTNFTTGRILAAISRTNTKLDNTNLAFECGGKICELCSQNLT